MRKLMASGAIVMLAAVCLATQTRGPNEVDKLAVQLRQSVQKDEMTKRDAVLEMEALARKYKDIFETTPRDDDGMRSTVANDAHDRSTSALIALHGFEDRHSLPLFEEMTGSEDWVIRMYGMTGYVRVAGAVDSLPFVERITKNPGWGVLDYSPAYGALIAIAFNELLPFWKIYNPSVPTPRPSPTELSPAEKRKVHTFMLEKVQTEQPGIVKALDEALAKHLPGYSNSVQRMEIAERFAKSEEVDLIGKRISDRWKPIKEEIEKTPANERKDFRAKGDLLDPGKETE